MLKDLREEDVDETENIDDNGKGHLQLTDTDGQLLNNITFFEDEVTFRHYAVV